MALGGDHLALRLQMGLQGLNNTQNAVQVCLCCLLLGLGRGYVGSSGSTGCRLRTCDWRDSSQKKINTPNQLKYQ